jgi:predicted acylesterase/phospholipase RssA
MRCILPQRIVLSGGGIRGVVYASALSVLEKRGYLKFVSEYCGVSAGAIVAFLICIGYSLKRIAEIVLEMDFSSIRNIEEDAFLTCMDTFGIDDGKNIEKTIKRFLTSLGYAETLTFAQLYALRPSAPRLRIFATNLNYCSSKEFSLEKTPHTELISALRASFSIPFYFHPVRDRETGHFFVDGALFQNIPFFHLSPNERKGALGITFTVDHTKVNKISSIQEYIAQIYASTYIPLTEDILQNYREQLILIPCGSYPMWDFEAPREARKEMMEKAEKAVIEFLAMRKGDAPPRRYSVS